jgi:hypothetical protein
LIKTVTAQENSVNERSVGTNDSIIEILTRHCGRRMRWTMQFNVREILIRAADAGTRKIHSTNRLPLTLELRARKIAGLNLPASSKQADHCPTVPGDAASHHKRRTVRDQHRAIDPLIRVAVRI